MHPVTLSGIASEGGTPTISVDTSDSFPCLVVGSKAPVADELYACYLSPEGYWYSERMKAHTTGTISYPCGTGGGACTNIPTTLTLTLSASPCGFLAYYDGTLTYGSTPSWASGFGLGSHTFMSSSTFTDSNGYTYNYFMNCVGGQYVIRLGYQNGDFGSYPSPSITTVIFGWSPTVGSNTCSPFSMVDLSTNNSFGCTTAHLTG